MPPTICSIDGIEVVVGTGLEVDHDHARPEAVPSTNEKYLDTRSPELHGKRSPGLNWNRRYRGVPVYLVIIGITTLAIGITAGAVVVLASKERNNPSTEPVSPPISPEPTSSTHTGNVSESRISTTAISSGPTDTASSPTSSTPTSGTLESSLSTPSTSASSIPTSGSLTTTSTPSPSIPSSSSFTETTAGAPPSQSSSASEENLQVFLGALGGVKASPITRSGDPTRPFIVDGEEMEDFDHAVIHSCDNQRDSCIKIPSSGDGDPTIRDCNAQKTQCLAVGRSASPPT
ncbi:hypothetical protein GGS26DRAFT_102405 [Hypomontagnella submonticulosa]|nr:hypothetical protein GGS26DRAFT_102405 [Hypomontagnella submonticulosa]